MNFQDVVNANEDAIVKRKNIDNSLLRLECLMSESDAGHITMFNRLLKNQAELLSVFREVERNNSLWKRIIRWFYR